MARDSQRMILPPEPFPETNAKDQEIPPDPMTTLWSSDNSTDLDHPTMTTQNKDIRNSPCCLDGCNNIGEHNCSFCGHISCPRCTFWGADHRGLWRGCPHCDHHAQGETIPNNTHDRTENTPLQNHTPIARRGHEDNETAIDRRSIGYILTHST